MQRHRIVIEGEVEDRVIVLELRGRKIIITADRPGVASALSRQIVDSIAPGAEGESRIGFVTE